MSARQIDQSIAGFQWSYLYGCDLARRVGTTNLPRQDLSPVAWLSRVTRMTFCRSFGLVQTTLAHATRGTLPLLASSCLLTSSARATDFPNSSVTDGVGVSVTAQGFSLENALKLRAAGVRVVRVGVVSYLIDINDEKDGHHLKWDFSDYEKFISVCAQAGLRIYAILDSGTSYCPSSIFGGGFDNNKASFTQRDWGPCVWKCYGSAQFRCRFDDFVHHAVKALTSLADGMASRVPPGSWNPSIIWELWNEPNVGFWPKRPSPKTDNTSNGVAQSLKYFLAHPPIAGYAPTSYPNCSEKDFEVAKDVNGDNGRDDQSTTGAIQYAKLAMGVRGDGCYPGGALQAIRDASKHSLHSPTIVVPAVASHPDLVDPTVYLKTVFTWPNHNAPNGLFKKIDGLSAHFYRETHPETVANGNGSSNFGGLRALMTQYGGGRTPIIQGEWGYVAGRDTALTKQNQADFLQRMMLMTFGQRSPVSIWFYDHDLENIEPSWYFGLFERYCDSYPKACADLCRADPSRCSRYCTDGPTACATLCARKDGQCLDCDTSPKCHLEAYWNSYGAPKPAFYASKTLTSSLHGARLSVQLNDGRSSDYLMVFRSPRGGLEKEILVAWTTDPVGVALLQGNQQWGTLMMTSTPVYLGQPLAWSGRDGNWSAANWADGGWPNDYGTYRDNYQAVFDKAATVNVDGEYIVSGLQFGAPDVTLLGGKLRLTPGGGNLYAARGLDKITSVLADVVDRANTDDGTTYTNTPDTFILRKSGGGRLRLGGDNTFHGRVLVADGTLELGSKLALGDISNPVTLIGGSIDFDGHSVVSGPLTISGNSGLCNNGKSAAQYTFDGATISGDLSISGTSNVTLATRAAPINLSGVRAVTKTGTNTVTIGGLAININEKLTFSTVQGAVNLAAPVTLSAAASIIGTINLSGQLYQNSSTSQPTAGLSILFGATLGGYGRYDGNLTLVRGSHLSPGSSGLGTIGTVSIDGNLRFAGASLDIDIASQREYDKVVLIGSRRTVTGSATVNLYNRSGSVMPKGSYTLIAGATGHSGIMTIGVHPAGAYKLGYEDAGGGRQNLVLTVT